MKADAAAVTKEIGPQSTADPQRWFALPILLTGAFLPVLDFNIVNLALPAIGRDLGASSSEIQFVISAYAATYAVFLITGGRLGDWLGRKPMFMLGVAGFTLASVLCGMASTPGILIAGRMMQGLTATLMAPQVLASIRVLFPTSEQGVALGLYGATFGLANIAGQVLGGVLVSSNLFGFTWQVIFLINMPIGLVTLVGSYFVLRDSRADNAQKLDVGGVVLLSATLGLLVYPLVEGRENGWPSWMIGMLAATPAFLAAFVWFERRVIKRGGSPLVDVALFKQDGFAIGIVMALLFYMTSAFYLTFSIYLQSGIGLAPVDAGLRILPFGVGYFLASFTAASIMQRLGPQALTLGFLVQVVGFGALALAAAGTRPWLLELGLLVAGMGFGVVMPSVIKAVIGGVDPQHAGLASGIVMSTLQIGAALGVAIVGGIFYGVLGDEQQPASYAFALSVALFCNVGLLLCGALLSLWLPRNGRAG